MGRRKEKLALELIPVEKSRKITFRKRKKGLEKKAMELSVLCDVKVCTIIYEKKSNGQLLPPTTYPEKPEAVKEIIDKYTAKSSKIKKVQNLADFYATQTMQVKKEIQKLRTKSYEEKYPTWDARLNQLSADQLVDVLKNLESKIQEAQQIRNKKIESQQQTLPPMASFPSNICTSQMLQKPSNYGAMTIMNERGWHYNDNNIPYLASNVPDYNITASAAASAAASTVASHKGTMWDYFGMFSNPVQQQPYSVVDERPPIEVPPLSFSYDQRPLSLSSYMKCPMPQAVSSSSGHQQQFAAPSQPQFSYVDDPSMYMYNGNMVLEDWL